MSEERPKIPEDEAFRRELVKLLGRADRRKHEKIYEGLKKE